ncbi:MAG: metal-dependent transcriptional regulator [Planctomycetaceae bacterium]|nr:metal-dependent transcriptional regulator [Planctomycetaceae bacterium]
MASLTVENYCKAILQIGNQTGRDWVGTGQVAVRLGVSPGTVTSMLKGLAESELAEYRPYEGVRLTRTGRALALRLLRRHRLIELFLVRTLGLTWDEVHEEAEHMEHAVSDRLADRIDEYLGRPDYDPHGDPIPAADGELRGRFPAPIPLTHCEIGQEGRLARVLNQDSEFLRYLSEASLDLGATVKVERKSREAGVLAVDAGGGSVSLGWPSAEQILVEPL